MDKQQEYLYNSEYVTISDIKVDDKDLCIVVNDREELIVARRSNLQKKEDSWGYKRAQERADEMRKITARAEERQQEIIDKITDAALKSLASRIKLNVAFGTGGTFNFAALQISAELEKMVKEKAPKEVKDEKFPF